MRLRDHDQTHPEGPKPIRSAVAGIRNLRHTGPTGVWPTLFTLGNLLAGFAAIHFAAKPLDYEGPWGWSSLTVAGALILFGMFLDSVDGSVARLTNAVTDIGGMLDSMADMVTFGVAPAFIVLNLLSQYVGAEGTIAIISPDTGHSLGKLIWAIAAIYACCAALRLARFAVQTQGGQLGDHLFFQGLPTPGAAGALVGLVLLHEHLMKLADGASGNIITWIAGVVVVMLPIMTLLTAIMMVSVIPYRHMANQYLRVKRSFGYTARVVVLLCLMLWFFQETLAIVFFAYVLSGPVGLINERARLQPGETEDF
ncbi:MAG: CDP-alcohol phosphatidyltransferase family protein [Phycisphaerales bacterium]|nr:CDP-alcohol phosphatidyltransferase family protein [Phycisphaerales bacterium]|tara:strand:+ start:3473 stop:4405 length:933 start_codon:yes stop_codon:yes gene_type:complete